mmetsp:Transcript_114816/g.325211  ORF Transcript_114816/g.325211 Transcript_114816/m.325211 type:complete len:259 (-) Transcript_114816:85-861(-)
MAAARLLGASAALLLAGAHALSTRQQPLAEGCRAGTLAYTSVHGALYAPQVCTVYCVPKGGCEDAMLGGSALRGNFVRTTCRQRGFTEQVPVDSDATKALVLPDLIGQCKGLTANGLFRMPPKAPAAANVRKVMGEMDLTVTKPCAQGTVAYRAPSGNTAYCVEYCIPEGQCQNRVLEGRFGLLDEVSCSASGFSVPAPAVNEDNWAGPRLNVGQECWGMTTRRFSRANSTGIDLSGHAGPDDSWGSTVPDDGFNPEE